MEPGEQDVKSIGTMTEGDLRRLIREEMSAQMKDVPSRADVDALVEKRIESLRQETIGRVQKAEDESEQRIKAAVGVLDAQMTGLAQRITGLGANMDTLKAMLMSIDSKITEANKSMDVRMQALAASQAVLDGRLDMIEPKLKANTEAIFGTGDGIAGMRGQVNTMALNMGTMREGLADINRWMARYDAHALQRQQQIERAFSFVNSWYVRLGVVVVVASLLDQTVGDLVKFIGGL